MGKYSAGQAFRLRREGVRKFMRLEDKKFDDILIMGDCGAYSYHKQDIPPYSPSEILDFYSDCQFTHGCSVDHIIFEFDPDLRGMEEFSEPKNRNIGTELKARWDITQENAKIFLAESRHLNHPFVPMGVIQGWSPGSMAKAALNLVKMGYDYLALGGMAASSIENIEIVLGEIRKDIPAYVKLHLLGFGKIDQIEKILPYGVESLDTTSPMLRAFKDPKTSFFMLQDNGIKYYHSIRIPQATENRGLKTLIQKGVFTQEFLIQQEQDALHALREFDQGKQSADDTVEIVMEYVKSTLTNANSGSPPTLSKLQSVRNDYLDLLNDRPWKICDCAVCKKVSIEVIIFRASNRNKRRGMHNTWVVNKLLKILERRGSYNEEDNQVSRDQSAAEQ